MPGYSSNPQDRSPTIALTIAFAVALVLYSLPATAVQSIRTLVRDASVPCLHLADRAKARWNARGSSERDEKSNALTATERELARWKQRCRALELHLAQLEAEPEPDSEADSEPLVVPDLLPAGVLGRESADAWRSGRLVDVGLPDGVRESAEVLAAEDDEAILDRGSDADVEAGHPVLAGRVIVGRIRVVGRWTSVVQPVTDPEYSLRVRLAHRTNSGLAFTGEGLLAGTGRELCEVRYVGSTVPVAPGDEVYSIPTDDLDTSPLFVGTVTEAELPEGAPHWTIRVKPAATGLDGRRVSVLRRRFNPIRLLAN